MSRVAAKPFRIVGGRPHHSAYRFYIRHYSQLLETGTEPPARPNRFFEYWSKRFVDTAKLGFEAISSPYMRFASDTGHVLLSPQKLLLTRAPWIVDIEHATPFVGTNYLRFDEPRTKWLVRMILERDNCLGIICWSEACRSAFSRKIASERVEAKTHVIYPSLEPKAIAERIRTRLKRLCFVFNRPEHNFYIKSGLEVVEAFRIAKRYEPTLALDIVGPVPPRANELLQSVEGLSVHGWVAPGRLAEVYLNADLLLFPTVTDTFGLVFLEAFSVGLPVLAVDWFAAREIVADNVNGLLIPKSAGLLSWMDRDGNPTMSSQEFIRRRISANPDFETSKQLADQILMLAHAPERLAELSVGATATVESGKFSLNVCLSRLQNLAHQLRGGYIKKR